MPSPRIVMAGTGFAAVREFLIETLPDAQFEQAEETTLRTRGSIAHAMLPAMSRIDGELMDRIEGLRLIQQWVAGLGRRRCSGSDGTQNRGSECAYAGDR